MTLPIVIIGGGGHAKVLAEALRSSGRKVKGYTDREDKGSTGPVPEYLGFDEGLWTLAGCSPAEVELTIGIGPSPRQVPSTRDQQTRFFRSMGYRITTVVHRFAITAANVVLDEGCQVMAGAVVQPGVHIGADAVINTRAVVDHDCFIGERVHVAPGAVLCGTVHVGNDTFIGAGAVIIDGKHVGAGALIAAGAVVTSDVPGGAKVMGAPARVCGRR